MTTKEHKYYIHLCFNGNRYECEDLYTVNRQQYVRWYEEFGYDCFDEIETKNASHLFLDAGDCDDPLEVTYLHDIRSW